MERSNSQEIFCRDYYMDGKNAGLSNYENYSWMEAETLALADSLKHHLGIRDGDELYDIGCARGFLVKALRMRGVNAWGYDISKWAIENCDDAVRPYVSNSLVVNQYRYDFINLKDIAEHVPISQLKVLIPKLCNATKRSLLFIVPLTAYTNGRYLREEDERDVTHVVRRTLHDWLLFLTPLAPDFTVSGSYHIRGLKPASVQVPQSCGFFTLTRSAP